MVWLLTSTSSSKWEVKSFFEGYEYRQKILCAFALSIYLLMVQILNRETTRAAVLNLRVHAG